MSTTERGIKVRPLIIDIKAPDQDLVLSIRKQLQKDLRLSKTKKKSLEWEESESEGKYKKQ